MNVWVRIVIAFCLCLTLAGLFVHAEVTEDTLSPYPDAEDLALEYDSYVGQQLMIFATVTETSENGIKIRSESNGESVTLRVTNTDATVEPGGVVQVYGTLRPDQTIAAERVEVVNSSQWAEYYKYGASALGALGFLVLFFRYWRIDRDGWTLEARDG